MNFKNVQNATNQLEKYLRTWKESEGCFDLNFVDEMFYDLTGVMPEIMVPVNDLTKLRENARKRQLLEEVNLLYQRGADLNYLERQRGFALIPNVFWNVEFIKFFVDRGMDVNSRDEHGDTALHLVVRHAHPSSRYYDAVSVLNYILNELSADPNIPNLKGDTALYTLAQSHIYYRDQDFKLKLANMMMEKGAIMASSTKSAAHIKFLMSYELKINTEESSYSTVPERNLIDSSKPPAEQAEMLEYEGARLFLSYVYYNRFNGSHDGFYYWDQAMDVYKRFDLEPSKEFSANYALFRANLNSLGARSEIFLPALNTVSRLSEGKHTKFWNLLVTAVQSVISQDRDFTLYFFHTVNFLASSKENYFERIEDFASSNQFDSLLCVVENFKDWLRRRVNLQVQLEADRISYLHSFVRLTIACFRNLLQKTKCKNMSGTKIELYITLINVLTFLHSRLGDVIPVETFNENKRLLRWLIDLDLRTDDGDSLMHVILKDYSYSGIKLELDLILALSEFANLKVKDVAGFEPSQYVKWNENETKDEKLEIMIKFADRGAHIDARNAFGGPTFKDVFDKERPNLSFKYDSLQCACARFLAGSLVPYAERLPKCMVDFIRMHSSYKFYSKREEISVD